MKAFATLLILFSATAVCAQGLNIDKAGKVISAPDNAATSLTPQNTSELDAWSSEQQQALQTELQQRLKATVKTLRDTNTPLSRYYGKLWTDTFDVSKLVTEYENLASSLPKSNLDRSSPLYSLGDLIANNYLDTKIKFYKLDPSDNLSVFRLKVIKTNIINNFLLSYYTKSIADPNNQPLDELNTANFESIRSRAVPQQRALNTSLSELRRTINLSTLNRAYDTHNHFDKYQKNDLLFKVLRTPWAKAWLWRSDGIIKLDPLPFNDEITLYLKFPPDTSKVRLFNKYVQKTLASKLKDPKDLDIIAFTTDISSQGKASSLFIDTAAFRKAKNDNRAAIIKTCLTKSVSNDIVVPKAKPNLHYLTYLNSQKDPLSFPAKPEVMSVEDRVVFTVHNLDKGHSLKLICKSSETKDQSPAAAQLDDVFTGILSTTTSLGKLAIGAFTSATSKNLPRKGMFQLKALSPSETVTTAAPASKNKSKKPQFKESTAHKMFRMAVSEELFWSNMEQIIKSSMNSGEINDGNQRTDSHRFLGILNHDEIEYNETVFTTIKKRYSGRVRKYFSDRNFQAYESLIGEISNAYFTEFTNEVAAPAILNAVRDDSLLLSTSLTVLNESGIPPRKVTPQTDEIALYHSDYAATPQSDTTKAYTCLLQDEVNSKPATFSTYQYRTGKRYRIQFAAGLTYTTSPVRNPELTTTNGQVNYTTTDTRYRVYAGLHIYPWRIMLQDKHFFGTKQNWYTRINILAGVGIPKPLDNFYLGLGYDLGPGIKVNTGVHLHGYTKYEVFNNQLVNQAQVYEAVGPFFSIGIDPATFVKAFTIFF